jgi:hypothetical protein
MIVSVGFKTKKRELEVTQHHSKKLYSCIGDAKKSTMLPKLDQLLCC